MDYFYPYDEFYDLRQQYGDWDGGYSGYGGYPSGSHHGHHGSPPSRPSSPSRPPLWAPSPPSWASSFPLARVSSTVLVALWWISNGLGRSGRRIRSRAFGTGEHLQEGKRTIRFPLVYFQIQSIVPYIFSI